MFDEEGNLFIDDKDEFDMPLGAPNPKLKFQTCFEEGYPYITRTGYHAVLHFFDFDKIDKKTGDLKNERELGEMHIVLPFYQNCMQRDVVKDIIEFEIKRLQKVKTVMEATQDLNLHALSKGDK